MTKLYGRDEDITKIEQWAENPASAPSVRLISGQGGTGKTRLAATVAQRLKDRGWSAGFIGPYDDLVDMQVGPKGLCLIIDYPEEQPDRINALFEALANMFTAPYPVRVLLLSRQDFAQWEARASVLQGRFGQHEIATPHALSVDDALALINEAAQNFAALIGSPKPNLSEAAAWLRRDEDHRTALSATSAAIHSVLSPEETFGLSGQSLLRNLALREQRRVTKISQALGFGEDGLSRLLAIGTIADGLSEQTIKNLVSASICSMPPQGDYIARLSRSGWWRDGRLQGLKPDRPAAAFVHLVLYDEFPKGRPAYAEWLALALPDHAGTFGDRLSRILFDLDSSCPANGMPGLDADLEKMLALRPDLTPLFASVASGEKGWWAHNFAVAVTNRLLSVTDETEQRAHLTNNLANRLSDLGQHEKALEAAQEAVELYRELARAHPEAFTRNLAGSLNNLAARLSKLGQHEQALVLAQEAVEIQRNLAKARPEAHNPDLAMSLNNLANRLSNLGQHESALDAAQEAVEIRRELARERPEALNPLLASSLNNLANRLSELGLHEQALEAAQEAVRLYRELARARPEAYTPNLATSLNNLANILSMLAQHEQALKWAQESAEIRRELARARPQAFAPELATSLNNLANMLSELGQHEEALEAAQKAVEIRRELARARPQAFTPELATSLNNLATMLSELGQHEQALEAAQKAVEIRRELARVRPEAFTSNLATSLHNLANRLSDLGEQEQALEAAQEAVRLYRDLAKARPKTFTPYLAGSLNNLANRLSGLGRGEQALDAAREAIGLYRDLAIARPEVFTPNLAGSLNNLANKLSNLGRPEEALEMAQEAAQLRIQFASTRPKLQLSTAHQE